MSGYSQSVAAAIPEWDGGFSSGANGLAHSGIARFTKDCPGLICALVGILIDMGPFYAMVGL